MSHTKYLQKRVAAGSCQSQSHGHQGSTNTVSPFIQYLRKLMEQGDKGLMETE